MIPIDINQAAEFSGGKLIGENKVITCITTDSRAAAENSLFVAVKGDKFDGMIL